MRLVTTKEVLGGYPCPGFATGSRTFRTIYVLPPPRRFAPISKTFRPLRCDDMPQFKTFCTHGRRFCLLCEKFRPLYVRRFVPIETFRPSGKFFRTLFKLSFLDPHACETFLSYWTFRTLGKSFRPVLIGRFAP